MPKAVIIKGNPRWTEGVHKELSDGLYSGIQKRLEAGGYEVELDPGEPETQPADGASLWVGHSRGIDRLRFAPEGVKTLAVDDFQEPFDVDPKNIPEGWNPPESHYAMTPELEQALGKLQPSSFDRWQQTKDPADLNRVVESVQPKIAYHLHRYGLGSDPLAAGQARIYAAKAIKSYKPDSGASLATWLDRNLQQLTRFKRSRATAIRVPEQMQLDNYAISRAAIDFEETHGREPELAELSDHAGLSVRRIDAVRGGFKKMTSEAPFEGNLASENGPDFMTEALEVTWQEGSKLDRKILEMKTGFGGRYQPMAPKDIGAALGMDAVTLSRRSARLAAKIEEIVETLET